MSSDLDGCRRRRDAGFRAEWELAAKLGPNPYAAPGKPDNGEKYAYFDNRVYRDGALVSDVKARVPDFFAATEEQLRAGKNLPGNFPKSLVEEAIKVFEDERREKQREQNIIIYGIDDRWSRGGANDHRQMAAEDTTKPYDYSQHYGR